MGVSAEIEQCKKKVKYPDEGSATRAAQRQMKMDFARKPLRPYPCEWCRKWHLTSKP